MWWYRILHNRRRITTKMWWVGKVLAASKARCCIHRCWYFHKFRNSGLSWPKWGVDERETWRRTQCRWEIACDVWPRETIIHTRFPSAAFGRKLHSSHSQSKCWRIASSEWCSTWTFVRDSWKLIHRGMWKVQHKIFPRLRCPRNGLQLHRRSLWGCKLRWKTT